MAHESGLIGLPLRLLAREVYGRVAQKVGTAMWPSSPARRRSPPPGARYSVCTVEAMPRETNAAFVAIDEVQLAADMERGHIFNRPHPASARQAGNPALGRRHDARILEAAAARPFRRHPPAHVASGPCRPEEDHAAAAAHRHRRLLRRRGLCHRRADPAPARRCRSGFWGLSARARAMPRSSSTSRGDVDFLVATRRHRHGPEPGCRPCRLRAGPPSSMGINTGS